MYRMKKRGISLTFVLFELVIVAIVFYAMAGLLDKTAKTDYFSNSVQAEDISLFIDTMYAAPGDLNILYQNKLNNKKLKFDENYVSVGNIKASYVSSQKTLKSHIGTVSYLPWKKTGNIVSITTEADLNTKITPSLTCPTLNTKSNLNSKKILIDPFYGGAQKGVVYNNFISSQLTSKIGYAFSIQNINFASNVEFSRPLEDSISSLFV